MIKSAVHFFVAVACALGAIWFVSRVPALMPSSTGIPVLEVAFLSGYALLFALLGFGILVFLTKLTKQPLGVTALIGAILPGALCAEIIYINGFFRVDVWTMIIAPTVFLGIMVLGRLLSLSVARRALG